MTQADPRERDEEERRVPVTLGRREMVVDGDEHERRRNEPQRRRPRPVVPREHADDAAHPDRDERDDEQCRAVGTGGEREHRHQDEEERAAQQVQNRRQPPGQPARLLLVHPF